MALGGITESNGLRAAQRRCWTIKLVVYATASSRLEKKTSLTKGNGKFISWMTLYREPLDEKPEYHWRDIRIAERRASKPAKHSVDNSIQRRKCTPNTGSCWRLGRENNVRFSTEIPLFGIITPLLHPPMLHCVSKHRHSSQWWNFPWNFRVESLTKS